jgi:hypothetical protein
MVNSASKFDHHAAWRRPSLAQERAAHAGHADLHRRELRPGRSVLRSIILPEHAGIISDAVPMLIVGRASRAWRGGRLGRCGHAAARPDSAYVGSWSMDAGRRSACMSMKKEWSASGQPCRGLQGSGWEQPVGSMHRCIELPCGPQAPESTRSCDK